MKSIRILPVILAIPILLAACQPPIPPASLPTATATLPPPTETATSTPAPSINLPLAWPMSPMTEEQINEARGCDIETLATQRYPESADVNELSTIYPPASACDWAVLAFACAQKSPDKYLPAEPCLFAFNETIARNPALIFRNQIFTNYFGVTPIVAAPPIAQKQLVKMFVRYSWTGLGDRVKFSIEMSRINTTSMTVNVDPNSPIVPATEEIKALTQALPAALTDLLPVSTPMTIQFCTDNYPSWEATLTFEDGTVINLTTSDSNLIGMGGPWQLVIGDQRYVQFSDAFPKALDALVKALGLKYGEPAGMFCSAGDDILNLSFPQP